MSISPVDFDELAPALKDALRARYERLGYLGGFFTHMAHQPEALVHFDAFTESLKRALGPDLSETVALTAATRLGNTYERHQHERLAVALGLGAEWVAAIERLDPEALSAGSVVPDVVVAAQRFVLAACDGLADGAVGASAHALDALVAASDDATASGVVLLAGRFIAHAVVSAACRLQPPVPSIFTSEGAIEQ